MRCKENQPSNLGSSETTREAPQKFNFNDYKKYGNPKHLKKISSNFLEWFIGFSEGDGSFTKEFSFVINQKDPKLLFKIKKNLGFGSVYETSEPGIWRYCVTGQVNCLRLFYLFNGHLILKKTQKRFLYWLTNIKTKIIVKQFQTNISLDNAWLSGFIEAEGGFYARIRKDKNTKLNIKFCKKFYLTQKDENLLLKKIGILLESKTKVYCFIQKEKNYARIDITSFKSHIILLNYLSIYPLLGRKNITVCIWKKMHGYQERKEHLIDSGITKLNHLCFKLKKHNKNNNIEVEDIVQIVKK